ncbi:hypothetical protein OROGR_027569 [Orobanche gracilis]
MRCVNQNFSGNHILRNSLVFFLVSASKIELCGE